MTAGLLSVPLMSVSATTSPTRTIDASLTTAVSPAASAAAASAASVTADYQAESAVRSGAVVARNRAGYTGSGFVDFLHPSGDYVQWTVTAKSAGTHLLQWRYGNGDADRPLILAVNGAARKTKVSMPPLSGWTKWRISAVSVPLKAGRNTIRLTVAGASGANIDKLTVLRPPTRPFSQPGVYQAEDGRVAGAVRAGTPRKGWTGTGYVDFVHPSGDSLQFTVRATRAGRHTLAIRYANGDSTARHLTLAVNGTTPLRLLTPSTRSFDTWSSFMITVNLSRGTNTVKFSTAGGDGPNVDRLDITPR